MNQKIEFAKDYAFAHHGHTVVEYKAGDIIENPSEELAAQAKADGVLKEKGEKTQKSAAAAPAKDKPAQAE